jgi:hypothetical protein
MKSDEAVGVEAPPRHLWQSAGAVFLGFFAVVVLSLVTDQLFHELDVYPPWGQPMHEPELNLLALAYRSVYTVFGGYLTAKLAPRAPMRHVLALGIMGLAMGTVGAIVAIPMDLGPAWYPIALAVTGLPLTWLGGILHRMRETRP